MKNWIIDIILKYAGLGGLWAKIDGYKTIIASISGLLHALAAFVLVLAGVLDQAAPLLQGHDAGGLIHLAQGLKGFGGNPNVVAFADAWKAFYLSLGILGLGHKIEKATTPIDPAPVTPAAQ